MIVAQRAHNSGCELPLTAHARAAFPLFGAMKYFCRYRVALSLSASLSSCIPCISILYSLACSHPLLRDLAPLRTHAPKSPHLLQIAPKKGESLRLMLGLDH